MKMYLGSSEIHPNEKSERIWHYFWKIQRNFNTHEIQPTEIKEHTCLSLSKVSKMTPKPFQVSWTPKTGVEPVTCGDSVYQKAIPSAPISNVRKFDLKSDHRMELIRLNWRIMNSSLVLT